MSVGEVAGVWVRSPIGVSEWVNGKRSRRDQNILSPALQRWERRPRTRIESRRDDTRGRSNSVVPMGLTRSHPDRKPSAKALGCQCCDPYGTALDAAQGFPTPIGPRTRSITAVPASTGQGRGVWPHGGVSAGVGCAGCGAQCLDGLLVPPRPVPCRYLDGPGQIHRLARVPV